MDKHFGGIEKSPDVCGGNPRVKGTRIPVWTLVSFQALGMSDEKILEYYPSLTATDLENTWRYHNDHEAEIQQNIQDQELDP
jgi:uncharacterized protein (DUF433 family)